MFLGWIVAGLTTTVIASSSAGIFGIAFLAPESPWFFVPVCIVCAIVGALLHDTKDKNTVKETIKKGTICAIYGCLIGAAATKYVWVVNSFPNGEFIVGGVVSLTISYFGKQIETLFPSVLAFIKNWLERK